MARKRQLISPQRSNAAANQRTSVLAGALAKVAPKRRDRLLRMANRQPVVLQAVKPKALTDRPTDRPTADTQLSLWAVDEQADNKYDALL